MKPLATGKASFQGVQRRTVLVVNFFKLLNFLFIFFCFVVAMSDLVQDVMAIHGLS